MMVSVEMAAILSELAGMVAREVGADPESSFLYAEAEDAVSSPSLFRDAGAFVEYIDCSHDLAMKIIDLWDATDTDKKWGALFLTIAGGQFDARFQYREEWIDDDSMERRERVLAAKYGNKEIVYPPWER